MFILICVHCHCDVGFVYFFIQTFKVTMWINLNNYILKLNRVWLCYTMLKQLLLRCCVHILFVCTFNAVWCQEGKKTEIYITLQYILIIVSVSAFFVYFYCSLQKANVEINKRHTIIVQSSKAETGPTSDKLQQKWFTNQIHIPGFNSHRSLLTLSRPSIWNETKIRDSAYRCITTSTLKTDDWNNHQYL